MSVALLKPSNPPRQRRAAIKEDSPHEALIKRGRYHKTYVNTITGKRIQKIYRLPQHYLDLDGNWHEYDLKWRQEGDEWINDGGPWTARLNLRDGLLVFTDLDGEDFELQLLEIAGHKVGQLREPVVEGQRLVFRDVAVGLDLMFRSSYRGVSVLRILKSSAAPRSFKWRMVGRENSTRTRMQTETLGIDNIHRIADRRVYDELRRLELTTERTETIYLPDGRYLLELTETWSGRVSKTHSNRTKEWADEVAYPVLIDPTFGPTDISASADDGKEYVHTTAPTWDTNLQNLQIGFSSPGAAEFAVGLRWQGITCSQGCAITSATINCDVYLVGAINPNVNVKGDLQPNAPVFSIGDLPSDVTGTGTVVWTPTATGTTNINVTNAVQAIVNQTGWASGNAMRFALTEPGTPQANRWCGILGLAVHSQPTTLPSLRIVWTTDAGTTPIVIDQAETITAADTKTATDAVAHDASSSSSDTNTTTLSWSHTCTGNQLVLTVGVTVSPGSVSVSGITYNGDPLTLATNGRQAGTNVSTELWYLVNPDAGSAYTVAVTLDGTAYAVRGGAVSFRNASQDANPLGTIAKQTGTSTSSSLNVTSDGDQMVVDILGKFDDGTATVNSGQTQRWQEN